MSLRSPSAIKRTSVASILALALYAGAAFAANTTTPAVQSYVDQAVPAPTDQTERYDSPLSAGTLTLQDVLEAHKAVAPPSLPSLDKPVAPAGTTAPLLTPPAQSSSTSLMMSQGMKAVLEKVGETAVGAPTPLTPPVASAQPAAVPIGKSTVATPAVTTPDGQKYEPGQEPKNLATGAVATPAAPAAAALPPLPAATSVAIAPTPTPSTSSPSASTSSTDNSAAASGQGCDQNVQKWEKSCSEVGYPANYIGKIVGETRTTCSDGTLHDFWVNNSCAPPEPLTGASAATDAVCGVASNNEFDAAPTTNLCAQGVAGTVSGDGPWTWACSGVNGGQAAACSARKRVPSSSGVCGAASGVVATSAPSAADLCASGYATTVKGKGPWNWSCHGVGGGSTQSCIAPVVAAAPMAAPVADIEPPVAAEAPAPTPMRTAPVAVTHAPPAALSEKGELCGSAAETLAYEAPEKDLCRVGTASVVNGDGPWSWSCTDNDGRTSSCRTLSLSGDASPAAAPVAQPVPQAAVAAPSEPASTPAPAAPTAAAVVAPAPEAPSEPACGLSASQPTLQAPTSDLCEVGKASSVRGSGPWSWTCSKSHRKVACETPKVVDGSCGAANGAALKSAPFAGLCASGTPTGIEGDGPWNWSCNGTGGGVTVSCAASVQGKVEGTCGSAANASLTSAPTSNLCASGTPSAVSGVGPWSWSCSGSNGGAVSSCTATMAAAPQAPGPKLDGLCGAANGVTAAMQPTTGLCANGSATSIVGNGPWNWNCIGENGGMSVSCTAPLEPPSPIDGACGGANGVPTLVVPESGLCAAGITGRVSGKGPWTWTCSGANGGNAASCVAPVAGKSGVMPSSMVPAPKQDPNAIMSSDMLGTAQDTDQTQTHAGLVTPRLPTPPSATMPALDKKVIPSLTPSTVPPAAKVTGVTAPSTVPGLADDSTPVTPPAVRDSIAPAPVLQEDAHIPHIPGNHLTLDPTISTILFTRGSGNIDDQVVSTLDRLAAVLVTNYDTRITLTAYADNEGSSPRDARRLSLTRALAIRDYLGSKGISDSRIDVRAEGANTTTGYIDRVDVKVND